MEVFELRQVSLVRRTRVDQRQTVRYLKTWIVEADWKCTGKTNGNNVTNKNASKKPSTGKSNGIQILFFTSTKHATQHLTQRDTLWRVHPNMIRDINSDQHEDASKRP